MKNKFTTLLKIQFLNQSVWNQLRYEADKTKKRNAIGGMVAIACIVLLLAGGSFLTGWAYGILGMAHILPGVSLAVLSIVILIFTIIKANGFLFAFHDYDLLMSLPVKPQWIISCKFMYMYINNFFISIGVLLPMSVVYMFFETPDTVLAGAVTALMWILLAVSAPLLPMTIGSLFSTIAVAVSTKSRFKVFFQVVISLVFILLIIVLEISFGSSETDAELFQQLENMGVQLQHQMHRIYPVSALVDNAINHCSILSMLAFLLLSAAVYFLFVKLVTTKYNAINTALTAKRKRKHYQMTDQKSRQVVWAIVHKEFKRFTSNVPYLMNNGIGMILVLLFSIVCVVVGIDRFVDDSVLSIIRGDIAGALPFLFLMVLTMSCTTSASLSLEGKNLWIIQSLPVSSRTVLQGKMLFNFLLLLPAGVVLCATLVYTVKLKIWYFFLYLLVTVVMIAFSSIFGMWMNLLFPKYEWENEIEVVKQGMSVMLGIFGNILIQMVLMGVAVVLCVVWNPVFTLLFISIVFALLSFLLYTLMMRKERRFVKG